MAVSITESKPVFEKRCNELLPNLKGQLEAKGIETYAHLAFAVGTPQVPPTPGDMTDFCNSIRAHASLGEAAAIKRLHFESVTLVMAELKQQVASGDVSEPSKRLPFLDKQNLLAAQKNRIVGLSHKGEQLPSHSLIDAAYSIVESGAIVYLPPSKCGSRDSEIQADVKQKPKQILTIEQGTLKAAGNDSLPSVDVGTEMRLHYALQRRGLAFDLVRLVSWEQHQEWTNKLFHALAAEPPQNFNGPSLSSLLRADRELFVLLATEVSGSLKPASAADKPPLDAHISRLLLDPRILVHLAPTPRNEKRRDRDDQPAGDINKNKKLKTTPPKKSSLPAELEGLQTKTKEGKPLCWHFNLERKCGNTVKKGRCKFGFHNCMKCGKVGHGAHICHSA